ncbi:hypothetical protein ABOM_001685 [Aspergillus bombycis]|uniref:Carrier domain-containing protein n=1 Tax=Aspergillus bombycis TaxID=109264 RepID=A0A1F8ADV3_9EURO|nr:hypothetical protein ABOM_001685 [Aspergillus bombycis]OGM49538.1 hypothetical protein ABOM_001685 [Aspergillus bombycis]
MFPCLVTNPTEQGLRKFSSVPIPTPSSQDIRRICDNQGVTLHQLMYAAWAVVLQVYTSADSVVFGSLQGVSGLRSHCFELRHDSPPLLSVNDGKPIDGSPSGFNTAVMFNLTGCPPPEIKVLVHVNDDEDEISVALRYCSSILLPDQASHAARAMGQAVSSIVRDPLLPVKKIQLVSSQDISLLLEQRRSLPITVQNRLDHLIRQQCRNHPQSTAIDAWDGRLTYHDLDLLSDKLANRLYRVGVKPGTFVPLYFEKSKWTTVAILGVIKAGGAFVLFSPSLPLHRLQGMITRLEASIIVCSNCLEERAGQLAPTVITVTNYQDEKFTSEYRPCSDHHLRSPLGALYASFTSGSTGTPKCAVISHSAYIAAATAQINPMRLSSTSRVLQYSSYTFDAAINETLCTLLAGGLLCVPSAEALEDLSPTITQFSVNWMILTPSVARILKPTDSPSLRTLLLVGEAVTRQDIRQWVEAVHLIIAYGPTECTPCTTMLPEVQGPEDTHCIGIGIGARCWITDADNPEKPLPMGAPGELLIEGPIVGEGYLGDPERSRASFIDPPTWLLQTGKAISRKLYRTGDIVRYVSADRMKYVGRKDGQVKINGQRLELQEVEHVLKESYNKTMNEVIVDVIVPRDGHRRTLVAFVVQPGASRTSDEMNIDDLLMKPTDAFRQQTATVSSLISRRLPRYMIPSVFLPLTALPVTQTSKINRAQLRSVAQALSQQALASYAAIKSETVLPSTTQEHLLLRLVKDVLSLDAPDINDDFFHLGGDSISAIQLIGRARQEGLQLQVSDVLAHPVLSDLAKLTEQNAMPQFCGASKVQTFGLLPTGTNLESLFEEASRQCGITCDDIEDVYPCTPLQEGMMAMTATQGGLYSCQTAFSIPLHVDISRLKAAWNRTAETNPILRTRIVHTTGGKTLQVVVKPSDLWEHDGFQGSDMSGHLFGLGKRLIRLALTEGTTSYSLSLRMHHAIYDGWSLPLLLEQVATAYSGGLLQCRPFTPFIEYVIGSDLQSQRDFWAEHLRDTPSVPFPPVLPSSRASKSPQVIAEQTLGLQAEPCQGITLATCIRLAWALTVSSYTGSHDVVMGLTSSGRSAPVDNIDLCTGPTITTMPFKVKLCPQKCVRDVLSNIQRLFAGWTAHEHFGMPKLRGLSAEYSAACNFQNLLVIQPSTLRETKVPDVLGTLSEGSFDVERNGYPLVMECFLGTASVTFKATFAPGAVHSRQMSKILSHFSHALSQILLAPHATLEEISTISPDDMECLKNWNPIRLSPVEDCIHGLIERHATARPTEPAISSWDGNLTYEQLITLSSRLADLLIEHAVGPEVVVPIYTERSKWTAVAMLAVLKAGGAFLLLDPSHPSSRIEGLCRKVEAPTIIVSSSLLNSHSPDFSPMHILSVGESGSITDVTTLSGQQQARAPVASVSPYNAAYVVFTSGSTGTPKGVIIEHRSFIANVLAGTGGKCTDKARVLQLASATFDASIAEILFTLVAGGCICVPREADRYTNLVEYVRSFAINFLYLTPSIARGLEPDQLSHLEALALVGEPMNEGDIATWANHVDLVNAYGPSECSIVTCFQQPVTLSTDHRNIGISASASCWIVDPEDHDTLLPIGAVGELLVEGPIVGRGYLNDPEKTAAAFIPAPPWLHKIRGGQPHSIYKTGDLVQYAPQLDGSLLYLGRKDTQVKLRGQRIELGEVEHYILRCAAKILRTVIVELVAAVDRPPALVAFLLTTEEDTADVPDCGGILRSLTPRFQSLVQHIRQSLKSELPSYMIPTRFLPLDHVPKASTGKADRRQLREAAASLPLTSMDDVAEKVVSRLPVTEAERILQELVEDVLQLSKDAVSMESNFFHLGGDSLTAIRLISRIKRLGWHNINGTDIYQHPVLSDLALKLDNSAQLPDTP